MSDNGGFLESKLTTFRAVARVDAPIFDMLLLPPTRNYLFLGVVSHPHNQIHLATRNRHCQPYKLNYIFLL